MVQSIRGWWSQKTAREQLYFALLLLLMAGSIAYQSIIWDWYIEDAAISFAYARNWAHGEGLVPFPGGERVEGYSNPTWVALLALWELVVTPITSPISAWLAQHYGGSADKYAIDSFVAAKVFGAVFGALTLPFVYGIAQHIRPKRDDYAPLLATVFLAFFAPFMIWNTSGLENSLCNLLLAIGIYRTIVEIQPNKWPIAPVAYLLLAMSRPEGILYGAAGGFWAMVYAWNAGRGIWPTLRWLAIFFIPFGLYHTIRYQYFAYVFPNTYYAKTDDNDFNPFKWDAKGWKYIRNWAWGTFDQDYLKKKKLQNGTFQGYLLPLWFIGITGLKNRGGYFALAATLVILGAVGPALDIPELGTSLIPYTAVIPLLAAGGFIIVTTLLRNLGVSLGKALAIGAGVLLLVGIATTLVSGINFSWLNKGNSQHLRTYTLLAIAVILPRLAIGRTGWRAIVLCCDTIVLALFFALWSGGDWMKGFRWMAMLSVPAAALLANVIGEIQDAMQSLIERMTKRNVELPLFILSLAGLALFVAPNILKVDEFSTRRETGPFSVKQRVDYMNAAAKRLHMDTPITNIDVDQGAHLWWSGHHMLDIAGLVDVPFAQNRFKRAFIREYVFKEKRPEFAHVHGSWANKSKIDKQPEWKRDYLEIPPYPTGKTAQHVGNHIRRELMLRSEWNETPHRGLAFEEGISLQGWETMSPEAGQGLSLYLEIGLGIESDKSDKDEFRIIAFLADANRIKTSWELPPGYDWYTPGDWKAFTDIFWGRFSLPLPKDLPTGRYDLGFAIIKNDGRILSAIPNSDAVIGTTKEDSRFAIGEGRFPIAITVVTKEDATTLSEADVTQAIQYATTDCTAAEAAWDRARRRMTRQESWLATSKAKIAIPFARCWAKQASETSDRALAVELMVHARKWDHRDAEVIRSGAPIAEAAWIDGITAFQRAEWEKAYRGLSDAVAVEPWRAWARRYAEEARAKRYELGTKPEREPAPKPEPDINEGNGPDEAIGPDEAGPEGE